MYQIWDIAKLFDKLSVYFFLLCHNDIKHQKASNLITNINNKIKTKKKQNYVLFKFRFRKHYGELF